jgi:LCP family protein required for cell wall assembly
MFRIFLGAVIVLLCAAGGTAVFVTEQVHTLSDALKQNGYIKVKRGVLATAGFGQAETILLVGDDYRALTKYYHVAVGHLANEMLLVRLDPSKPYISMMSIPRELQAQIYSGPGQAPVAYTRLNFAYHFGINGLVTTIKRDFGLPINHVVVATFASFERAVNEMGCVYSTVDQRYYHVNVPGGAQYQQINLQPGYQKMCGSQAEQFVSYRHTDTSLVRDARDQSFLLDVKKEFGPTLVDNAGKFEHIFGQAVVTDPGLQSSSGLINLLYTLINMSSRHVRQVQFQVNLQPTGANPCSCDTATPRQIEYSVHSFLYGGSPVPPASASAAQARAVHGKKAVARLPLVQTPSSALGQARSAAAHLPFPLEYPRVEDRGGSVQSPSLRVYDISGPGGVNYPAYVGVFYDGGLGNYYDVQGTSWTTAPQFDSPDETVSAYGRTYYLFYDASNLNMVAWYEHEAVYWVKNSLTNSVPNGEMLAIAEQTQPFVASGAGPHATPVLLQAARVPFPTTARKPIPLRQTIGDIAALVTLVALPLLLFLAIRRFLDLRKARVLLDGGEQIGARLPFDDAMTAAAARSPVPLLAPQVAFAGSGALLPRSVSWVGKPTVYRRISVSRSGLLISLLVVLALGAAGAAAAVLISRHHPPPVHRVKRPARPPIPSVAVVVLNATTIPGAAHRLAVSLQRDRIKVSSTGNLAQTLPPGNEILYAPGERSQADLLQDLFPHEVSTTAPMDPVIAGAAGNGAKLVVVITS